MAAVRHRRFEFASALRDSGHRKSRRQCNVMVNAMEVPLAQMFGYASGFAQSFSQGRASVHDALFDHYAELPAALAEEVD